MKAGMIIGLGLVGLAGLLAARHACRRHGAVVLLWRWLSGHHLGGVRLTDAGWLSRGEKPLAPHPVPRWHYLPRAHRAGIRTGATLAALGVAGGLLWRPADTMHALGAAAAALGLLGLGAAWRATRAWRHVRTAVRPLHHALGAALGIAPATRPAAWLTVPLGYAKTQGAEITVSLPKRFGGGPDAKRAVEHIVCAKLGLTAPGITWDLFGKAPTAKFTVQIPPPKIVRFDRARMLIAETLITAPLIGIGRGARPVYADLDGDSPHALVSAGSGAGKSVTTRTLVAQILSKGGVALVLDVKRLSQAWCRGLPNVRYCRDIAQIHDALVWLSDEVDRRNRLADDGADMEGNTDQVDVGPRIIVLAEEMNATVNRLNAYWRSIRAKDDPNTSPAVEALGDALFMGRQIRVNILAVAQMLTARTVGGPEARENLGIRILARYTMNNWRILVPEIWPMPKSSTHKGRVQVCVGGEAVETQVCFLKVAEARELATSGIVAVFPGEHDEAAAPTIRERVAAHVERAHVERAHAEPLGLAAAVAQGIVPGTLEAVRKAAQRDPEFPAAVATGIRAEKLYMPGALAAWAANRTRGGTAAAAG